MDLMEYLKSAKKSLFRWEALQEYRFDGEDSGMKEWWEFIQDLNARGVLTQRVRLIVFPCTPYTLREIEFHKISVSYGDDIGYIDSAQYTNTYPSDYWLIDDETVLTMHYGTNGEYEGFSASTDRVLVASAVGDKMEVLSLSTPIKELNL